MRWGTLVTVLASLAAPAVSYSIDRLPKRDSGLEVVLSSVGNTEVKAVVSNKGNSKVSLLNFNSVLDSAPVHKVSVQKNGNVVPFGGIFYSYLLKDIPQKSFTTLEPGASVDTTFDIASTSDLSEGGDYVVSTEGIFAVAEGKGTELTGAIKFKSNVLEIDVDGKAAAKVNKAIKPVDKRANVDSGCSGSEKDALLTALQNSAKLASAAASAADGAKFEEYFRTSEASAKQTVVDRLNAVATESGSSSSGVTQYYCDDPYNYCDDGVLAWTLPTQNIVSNCPLYYSAIPPLSSECHAQDQATTTLHELTHADGVYSPFCDDHAYGYEASIALPSSQALQNADSYALFANAIHVGC